MVILITGTTHTGKTLLAQNILEKYNYPYMSIDHLKMGLIRSKNTKLNVLEDDKLTDYLWPIICEIAKTVIENKQNLIIEGGYIPFDWRKDFESEYIKHIKYICLVMTDEFIESNFSEIKKHSCDIELRKDDSDLSIESLKKDNRFYRKNCQKFNLDFVQINELRNFPWADILSIIKTVS